MFNDVPKLLVAFAEVLTLIKPPVFLVCREMATGAV
jgi:hypothetical protein